MYKLKIKPKDWFLILVTGVLFSSLLSMLGYTLFDKSYLQGIMFGGVLGFCITVYSLILITFMNRSILPKVAERYWNIIAMFFSFFSGFFGFLSGLFFSRILAIELLAMLEQKLYMIAFIVGALTYVMGVIIYSFVNIRNQKEVRDYEFVQSRLKSLETQLNPHFIFNALNSIAELIHQDKNKAENAIIKMSAFLRNTMDEKALIPLVDEVRNIHSYLELENIRFGDQIQLRVDTKIPNWLVPKFSLQLLIENAIKHGYNRAELHIDVSFDLHNKAVVVSNDGIAIANETFGVGLKNLKQRVELLCGGDIKISDTTQNQFTISLGKCNENTYS